MAINLTDSLNAATVKGKIADAKQVFLDGDERNIQQAIESMEADIKKLNEGDGGSFDELKTSIADETRNREAADNSLGERIDGLDTKIDDAIKDIKGGEDVSLSTLKQNIEDEKKARESGDANTLAKATEMIDRKGAEYEKKLEDTAELYQNILNEKIPESGSDAEIDAYPTEGSGKMVSSGGVAAYYGTYEDNPEFVKVFVDAEKRILWGIQKNGNIVYGAGVPRQVKEYIQAEINKIYGSENPTGGIDSLKEIIDFLETYKNSDRLRTLLDAKVDKEDGKSLINSSYADSVSYEDFPGFLEVMLDSEGNVVRGINESGEFVGGGINLTDLKKQVSRIVDDLNNSQLGDTFSYGERPGWIYVITDANDTILAGIKEDGTAYFYKLEGSGAGISEELQKKLEELEKKIGEIGKGDSAEVIDDIEGRREMTLDIDNKIVSYRDSDGILHENSGIKTNKLILTDEGMSDFEKAVKGVADFSRNEVVELPEPKHYALLNLTLVGGLPRKEGEIINGYAEYYDFAGNSFKKSCAVEIQGQTSKHYAETGGKGNYTLDITDGSELKFGSWVPQDSFHIKGCGKDVTRGFLATSYKLAYKLVERLDAKPNRYMALADSETTERTASGDRFTDWGDSARCLPDGFPIEVYLDGKYWGLYALQLKKHRKNYSMKKSDYTTVLVEGSNYMSDGHQDGFWTGDIWWNQIEIRNPKDLVLKNGNTYDNDVRGELMGKKNVALNNSYWRYSGNGTAVNPVENLWDEGTQYKAGDTAWMADDTGEWWYEFEAVTENSNEPCLIITDNEIYDSGVKVHKNTIISKDIINTFPKRYIEVKNLIAGGNVEDAKEKFKEYFDYNACMVVFLFNGIMRNGDSIQKNTLWGIYQNGKIAPMLWDLDSTYGESFTGLSAKAPSSEVFTSYANSNWPLGVFWTLFESDIKTTYAALRKEGVISIETWRDVVYNQWINRIGAEAYERDIDKWPDTPSYRKDNLNSEYWATIDDDGSLSEWSSSTQYVTGNMVRYTFRSNDSIVHLSFRAVKDNTNKPPLTKIYSYPYTGGYFNSPKRMEKWMIRQLELCDNYMGYTN